MAIPFSVSMNPDLSSSSDRRRSERILHRISVRVEGSAPDGTVLNVGGAALVISPHGALLRVPAALEQGSSIAVTLLASGRCEPFRVVWTGGAREDGHFDAGIEMQTPTGDFWSR